jgi:hypothetical protein
MTAAQKNYQDASPEEFLKMRTLSNRPLISEDEQLILYSKKIAIIGLSVGSQAATTLVRSGIGREFILVDPDVIELKNLNRTPFFLKDVGKKKSLTLRNQLLQIDPHLIITEFDRVVTAVELKKIVKNVDLVIDAFDDFKQKIQLRKLATAHKKPIITGFDIDKGVLVIIERNDLETVSRDIFFNGIDEAEITKPSTSITEKIKTFISLIGEENHTPEMLDAVRNVGTKYAGIPQLMIATNLLAASWSIAAISIILNKKSTSVRKYINLESAIYD